MRLWVMMVFGLGLCSDVASAGGLCGPRENVRVWGGDVGHAVRRQGRVTRIGLGMGLGGVAAVVGGLAASGGEEFSSPIAYVVRNLGVVAVGGGLVVGHIGSTCHTHLIRNTLGARAVPWLLPTSAALIFGSAAAGYAGAWGVSVTLLGPLLVTPWLQLITSRTALRRHEQEVSVGLLPMPRRGGGDLALVLRW
jgi:hypothetical protein